jgi:hypothetical protein
MNKADFNFYTDFKEKEVTEKGIKGIVVSNTDTDTDTDEQKGPFLIERERGDLPKQFSIGVDGANHLTVQVKGENGPNGELVALDLRDYYLKMKSGGCFNYIVSKGQYEWKISLVDGGAPTLRPGSKVWGSFLSLFGGKVKPVTPVTPVTPGTGEPDPVNTNVTIGNDGDGG